MKGHEKLNVRERTDLINDLLEAFGHLSGKDEAALFLVDLLTSSEIKILSRRLRIARLILSGKNFEEISKEIHASRGTIAKISLWLGQKGLGFKKVVARLPKNSLKAKRENPPYWYSLKNRYPGYYALEGLFDWFSKGGAEDGISKEVLGRSAEKERINRELDEENRLDFASHKKSHK